MGDPAEMFDTFVTYVNEQCGGIRGRMIDLHTIHVDVLGDQLDEIRNAACIEAIEDNDAVIIVNSSGFQGSATLCIVEEHETAFITVQPQPEEFMNRSGDRLITMTADRGGVAGLAGPGPDQPGSARRQDRRDRRRRTRPASMRQSRPAWRTSCGTTA